ncbi:unnamed protein product [Mucor hiemalis]
MKFQENVECENSYWCHYNVTKSAVGVLVHKNVGNRYLEKRVNVRVEHIKHSKCRQEFLDRVVSNAQKKKEAKEAGVSFNLKRIPAQPREARHISTKFNVPQTIAPIAYETLL